MTIVLISSTLNKNLHGGTDLKLRDKTTEKPQRERERGGAFTILPTLLSAIIQGQFEQLTWKQLVNNNSVCTSINK